MYNLLYYMLQYDSYIKLV